MFDDLHDPDPPRAGGSHLLAVSARAKQLRMRRYVLAGSACAIAIGFGAGALALTAGGDRGGIAPALPPPTAPSTAPGVVVTATVPVTGPSTARTVAASAPATAPPVTTPPAPATAPSTPVTSPDTEPVAPPVTSPPTPVTDPSVPPTGPETSPPTAPAIPVTDPSVDPTVPPPDCGVPAPGLLAVVDGDLRRLLPDGTSEMITSSGDLGNEIVQAFEASDGTIWVEVAGSGPQRVIGTLADDGRLNPIRSGEVDLAAVGELRGVAVAAIVDNSNEPYMEIYGSVELLDAGGDSVLSIPEVNTPTGGVATVGIGGDTIAFGMYADLGEAFEYYDADGNEAELHDPDDPYGQPPLFISPIPSPDGSELAWLEGPDGDASAGGERIGTWELVVGASGDGAERLRIGIGVTEDQLISSDFDGRRFVANFGVGDPGTEPQPSRSVIIDTASQPRAAEVCGGAATVTLSRADPVAEPAEPLDLDALTLTLELESDRVRPGGDVASTLVIENDTDETIVDPGGCTIGGARWGVVPRADPGAALSHSVTIDCSNTDYPFDPGSRESRDGPTFEAADRPGGDPLEAGEYFAAVEIEGRSERLLVPVVVEG